VLNPQDKPSGEDTEKTHTYIRLDWVLLAGIVVFSLTAALTACELCIPAGPP
jgi:hypothetical protein